MTQPALQSVPPLPQKRRLVVRAARADEGEIIKQLVSNGAFPVEMAEALDWADVSNYWIVADDGGRVTGCLQVVYAKPIGRLEYMGLDADLTHPQRARIVKALLKHGCGMMKRGGVALVSGTIPFAFKSYKRMLKRRGGVVTAQGNVFLKATSDDVFKKSR